MENALKNQRVILNLLSQGKTLKEIGENIGQSSRTIEATVVRIKKKHKARNMAHLIWIAASNGLCDMQ